MLKRLNKKTWVFLYFINILTSQILYCRESDEEIGRAEPHSNERQPLEEKKNKDDEEPPEIGIFSLPGSQQPSVLFGFGGNIIDAGEVQLLLFTDPYFGKRRRYSEISPSILFGITDSSSILFNFPFSPYQQDGDEESRGFFDCSAQFEYAFYTKSTKTYVDQATIVTGLTVPTGSVRKNPPTGFGAPGVFLGATYYHTTVSWFVYFAPGTLMSCSDHRTKIGDRLFIDFGIGRTIPSPPGWVNALILEIDDIYAKKDRIKGSMNHDSGGNILYVNPSLWFSTKDIQLQLGLTFPVLQNLYGKQRKFNWGLEINFAKSFY